MGKYQSGQMGQTVNLLAYAFGGSNPSSPTNSCGRGSSRVSTFGLRVSGMARFCLINAYVAQG